MRRVYCRALCGQEISIDSGGRPAANAGSAMLTDELTRLNVYETTKLNWYVYSVKTASKTISKIALLLDFYNNEKLKSALYFLKQFLWCYYVT